ncbi:hypothetical protein BGW80DRAFT_1461722 [Lactifluus volemus]|nr:hypothetical protein BGW80DRAFT_1461722 [Lactifluus volemus]
MSQRRTCFYLTLDIFRFALVGHDDDLAHFSAVVQFLRARLHLRRLDLGTCPWELVRGLFPELTGLRVLRVHIASLTNLALGALVRALPREMLASHPACTVSDWPMHEYAPVFAGFGALSMLHLHGASIRRPQPPRMHGRELQLQTEARLAHARDVALAVQSINHLGWHDGHFVVVHHHYDSMISSSSSVACGSMTSRSTGGVELRELPIRWRLDCGKGIDLWSDDTMWVERKDVPIDYEASSLVS